MMKKSVPAVSPEAYVTALTGWQRRRVEALRATVLAAEPLLEERIKWGHLVYFSNGPVLLIRAEEKRVLFGFWRGKRLRDLEPGLKTGGKYEMATQTLLPETVVEDTTVVKLVKEAVEQNRLLGDPTKAGV